MASNSILLSKVLLLILFIISQHSLGLYFYPGMYRLFISCNDQVLQSSENDQPISIIIKSCSLWVLH